MKIIGRLLKKSSEISFRRINRKNIDYKNQLLVLCKLLNAAKQTQIGFYHNFSGLLKSSDIANQYQLSVPISDYEEFYAKWLHKTIAGQKDNTWKGKLKYYALSSGTTGAPSKRIPVSIQMIRSFQKTSFTQFSVLHDLDLTNAFYESSMLAIGGSTQLVKVDKHIEGDLSGILKKHASLLVKPITKPGDKISAIKDWNEKLNAIVEKADKWNIGLIAGVPSWCLMLMERIVKHYNLESIHEIWPNLQVYVHGGVFMGPYEERFKKIFAKKVVFLDTYLASEGYFAYQTDANRKGMKLLLNNNIYFEFIPFNSDYFNENGELISKHIAHTIGEVVTGIDYALVISTNAGLWRYLLGDLIRFTDVSKREIIISGRIKQYLSVCGEHLSLDNIHQALLNLSKKGIIIDPEFTISADLSSQSHHWYLETSQSNLNKNKLIATLEEELYKINDDYKSARKYTLSAPSITLMPSGTIYDYMKTQGKIGAQNKMPRVLSEGQKKQWESYLADCL